MLGFARRVTPRNSIRDTAESESIMGMEFETAAAEANSEQVPELFEFKHDGRDVKFFRPSPGAIAMAMAMTADRQKDQNKVSAIIDFFFSVLSKPDQVHFQERLFKVDDPFDMTSRGGINDVLEYMFEAWAARPTRQSDDSTTSPPTTGSSSMESRPELTSSSSQSAAS